jgi:hypothetical protein
MKLYLIFSRSFVKLYRYYFAPFCFVLFRFVNITVSRNTKFHEIGSLLCEITKYVSLSFREKKFHWKPYVRNRTKVVKFFNSSKISALYN